MRIAVVGINYAPELTGIAVYTTGLAEDLAARGIDVTAYTGFTYYPAWSKQRGDRGRWYRRERINAVDVRRSYLYVPSRPTAWKRMLHELSFVISVAGSYLLGPKADCTIIVSPPLLLGIPIALLAKLKRSKAIFHVQDLQPDAAVDLGMLKKGRLTALLYRVERITYKLVHNVSTISHGMLERISGKGVDPEKLFIFRNWANDDHVVPAAKQTRYRDAFGLNEKFVVLYSGNMGVKQGLDVLLEAAEFLKNVDSVVFLIVGDGGQKRELQARAHAMQLTNLIFLPLQPYDRLGELLATADVSVIPQKKGVTDIVLPSKLGNIFASERPVIAAASEDCEFGRIVRASGGGVLVKPGHARQIADAVMHLYASPEKCVAMARAGRRFMEKEFSRRSILDEFTDRIMFSDEPRVSAGQDGPVEREPKHPSDAPVARYLVR